MAKLENDRNLKKLGQPFQVLGLRLRKITKNYLWYLFLREFTKYLPLGVVKEHFRAGLFKAGLS